MPILFLPVSLSPTHAYVWLKERLQYFRIWEETGSNGNSCQNVKNRLSDTLPQINEHEMTMIPLFFFKNYLPYPTFLFSFRQIFLFFSSLILSFPLLSSLLFISSPSTKLKPKINFKYKESPFSQIPSLSLPNFLQNKFPSLLNPNQFKQRKPKL